MVSMSKTSRKFRVPGALAHVYDFANTLDLRSFVHHGVKHEPSDELGSAGDLAAWLAQRGLPGGDGKVTPKTFHAALRLREGLREYLERDPTGRSRDRASLRKLNESLEAMPFVVHGEPLRQSHEDTCLPRTAQDVVIAEASIMPQFDKSRLPSRHVTLGPEKAPMRSMMLGTGLAHADLDRPLIGVATTWSESSPCNMP